MDESEKRVKMIEVHLTHNQYLEKKQRILSYVDSIPTRKSSSAEFFKDIGGIGIGDIYGLAGEINNGYTPKDEHSKVEFIALTEPMTKGEYIDSVKATAVASA